MPKIKIVDCRLDTKKQAQEEEIVEKTPDYNSVSVDTSQQKLIPKGKTDKNDLVIQGILKLYDALGNLKSVLNKTFVTTFEEILKCIESGGNDVAINLEKMLLAFSQKSEITTKSVIFFLDQQIVEHDRTLEKINSDHESICRKRVILESNCKKLKDDVEKITKKRANIEDREKFNRDKMKNLIDAGRYKDVLDIAEAANQDKAEHARLNTAIQDCNNEIQETKNKITELNNDISDLDKKKRIAEERKIYLTKTSKLLGIDIDDAFLYEETNERLRKQALAKKTIFNPFADYTKEEISGLIAKNGCFLNLNVI